MLVSNKEDSQRMKTLTDNKKRETTKTKDLQCMMAHAVASTTLTDSQVFQVTSHIVGIFTLYFVSSIQFVAVPIYSISDLYANSLYSFTLRKRSCDELSLQLVFDISPDFHT